MADTPGSHILEIRAGNSQRSFLELPPGVPVQPMSIGRVGMWQIDAPDVLDVHAFVYFDGRALFLQSASAGNPAKGNGQAIGTTWQQIEIPCTIEIGRARLVYRTVDEVDPDGDEDKTIAQAVRVPNEPAQQFRPNVGMFSNRDKGPDSDATRLQPMMREPDPTIIETGTPMAGVPKARPAAGMPAWSSSTSGPTSSPTVAGAPPAPPPPQNTGYQGFGSVQVAMPPAPNPMMQTLQAPLLSPLAQQQPMYGMPPQMMQQPMMHPTMPGGSGPNPTIPAAAETGRVVSQDPLKQGFNRALTEWRAMPPLRKVIFGSFPGVALLVYFMLFDDDPPPQQVRHPKPPPSGQVTSAKTGASTMTAPIVTAPTAVVTATGPTTTTTVITTSTATSPPIPTATVTTTATATATLPKGTRTLERQAIDLVAQGQYPKAVEIYDQLAQQHPEQPAFKEAVRLLRQRTNGP